MVSGLISTEFYTPTEYDHPIRDNYDSARILVRRECGWGEKERALRESFSVPVEI